MPRLRRTAFLGVFIIALGTPAAARADSPSTLRAMTLDDAIAFARAHQPEVRVAMARVAAQREQANVPRSQWLPVAGATAQIFALTANNTTGTYVSPGSFMDIPRIGGTRSTATGTFAPDASTIAAVGFNQEVFDFGRIAAETAAADALVSVEEERARSATLDITFGVEEAYFAVLAAKAVVKASEEAVDRSRAHRDLAKAGVDAGLRSPIDLTRAEADLARFDIGAIRARGGLTVARATLAATVGVDDAALDTTEASPADAPEMPPLETALGQAEARHPRVREAMANVRAEEERTRAIGARRRPDLGLTGTFSGRAGGAQPSGNGTPADGSGFVPNVPNWDVGLVLSWAFLDPTASAQKNASAAREEVRRSELGAIRHEQAARVRIAYASVESSRTALPGFQRALVASHANYAQAEARFRSGMGTSIELADAESVRTSAEIELALGRFQLARARAAFGRAIAEGM